MKVIQQPQDLPPANRLAFSGTDSVKRLKGFQFLSCPRHKKVYFALFGFGNQVEQEQHYWVSSGGLAQLTQKQQVVGNCRAPQCYC